MNSPDTTPPPLVVNVADVPETVQMDDAHWGGAFKPLTPALDALGRQGGVRLGMNLSRVPPGRSGCPYPDSGKVMVRSLKRIGVFEATDYMHGEATRPKLLDMRPPGDAQGPGA